MKLPHALLSILADGRFHSGTELGEKTTRTRAAVWKAIQALQDSGLEIFSVRGKGYRLARPIELLQRETILQGLDANSRQHLNALEVFSEIDSTNSYLLEIAKQGEASAYACLAEQQHAGRGRRGRNWVSPYGGNIYLSLLWRFNCGAAQLGGLSLAVGVAVNRALRDIGLEHARLKWPNDILLDERKLAGILLEMAGEASGPCVVVMGIGLNVRTPAAAMGEVEQAWVDLESSLPHKVGRNQLVSYLLQHLIDISRQFEQHGFHAFQDEWNENHAFGGRQVELQLPDRQLSGVALGVDRSGALLLSHEGRTTRFHGGEVSLRVPS